MIRFHSPLVMVVGVLLLAACEGGTSTPTTHVTASGSPSATTPVNTVTASPTAAAPTPAGQTTEDPQQRVIAQLRAADRAIAYRILPSAIHLRRDGVFTAKEGTYLRIGDAAYPVRSQAITLAQPQFTSLREHLLALEAAGPDTEQLACIFSPGVAICFEKRIRLNNGVVYPEERWERTAVLLVCYGCQELALIPGDDRGDERPWWNRYFFDKPAAQAALFALAKELFPDDPAIQAMTPKSARLPDEDD